MFVDNGDSREIFKLFGEVLQQGNVLWYKLILQVTGNIESGSVAELFDQLHHSSRWSFSESLILQLRCSLHNIKGKC